MTSPLLPLPPHFSHSQSILGRPPNPPSRRPARRLLPHRCAHRPGLPPSHAGDHHVVTVANLAGYIRNNAPTAVPTSAAAAVQARPLGFAAAQMYDHQHQQQRQEVVHQGRPLQQPPQEQQGCPQFVIPRPVGSDGVSMALNPDSAAAVAAAHASVAAVHAMVTSFEAQAQMLSSATSRT